MLGAPRPPRAPPAVRADPPRALPLPPRRRPALTTAPPARCLSGKKLRAQCLEKLARAGRRFARAPEFPAERERPGTLCNSPAGQAAWHLRVPPAPASPSPHTHARICTRARTHICTQTLPRALAPAHTQGCNKGRGARAALLFFLFSLLQPPRPAPARPPAPTPPSAPRDGGGLPAFQSSASERQLRARAPAPRSPAGGRQKLRRRRRPRGQGVLANCQEMCVCAPGAGGRGRGGRLEGERRRGDPPPSPATRPRRAPEPGLENKLSDLFSLGCG